MNHDRPFFEGVERVVHLVLRTADHPPVDRGPPPSGPRTTLTIAHKIQYSHLSPKVTGGSGVLPRENFEILRPLGANLGMILAIVGSSPLTSDLDRGPPPVVPVDRGLPPSGPRTRGLLYEKFLT